MQSEMAKAAKEAYEAGASVVHIHFRDQRPGKGHLPTWWVDASFSEHSCLVSWYFATESRSISRLHVYRLVDQYLDCFPLRF